jgi:RNA polymerase sigma-70 factor, ECF subfamily
MLDDLVRRTQAGDVEAFEGIVRRFETEVRGWLIARCPPGGDTDNVAQNAFVEAFRRIGEYSPGTDFRAWLFAISRYQLLAECTRLKRHADYRSRYLLHTVSAELERRAAREEPERLLHLRECLAMFALPVRNVLEWRYRDELSLQEIADRSNRSVASTKKWLFMLREKLRECVDRKLSAEGL